MLSIPLGTRGFPLCEEVSPAELIQAEHWSPLKSEFLVGRLEGPEKFACLTSSPEMLLLLCGVNGKPLWDIQSSQHEYILGSKTFSNISLGYR